MSVLSEEGREAIRESNRRRNIACGRCGACITVVDGSKIDGMPGLNYKYCYGCGWSRAITKRQGREKLRNA